MFFFNGVDISGLVIGLFTFLMIGFFHLVVVKCEYYFGTKCWWVFLLPGIGATVCSLLTSNLIASALLGVLAFTSFWTIKELFQQEQRVRKGWFPKNPKRTYKF